MPRVKTGIGVHLSPIGKERLDRLCERSGATQASTIEESLLMMERVVNGENVFDLYSEPFKYLVAIENEKGVKKLREAIFGGLQQILNNRLRDLHAYSVSTNSMIAEIFRLVTKSSNDTESIVNEYFSASYETVKEMERERYKLRDD